MTAILDTIVTALASVDGVQPLLGKLPKTIAFPAIRYAPVGGVGAGSLRGESDLRNVILQVDCFAKTLVQAWSLAESARKLLTAKPLYGTLQVAPFSLPEPDLDVERVTFQMSIWGSAT